MQYQKKNLWTIALACALAVAFASGCDDKPSTSTGQPTGGQPTGGQPTGTTAKSYTLREWKKIPQSGNTNYTGNITGLEASGNGNFVYFTANAGAQLFAADLTAKFDDITDDTKWAPAIVLGSTGLATTVGEALMAAATVVLNMAPTKEGVLVGRSVNINGTTDDAANGVAWLKGRTWTAAWLSDHGAAVHIAGVTDTTPLTALGVLVNGNDEIPAFYSRADRFGLADERVTLTGTGYKAKVNRTLKKHGAAVFTAIATPNVTPHMAMVGADAVLVDPAGVHVVRGGNAAAGDIGNASAKLAAAGPGAGAATAANTLIYGAEQWSFVSAGTANVVPLGVGVLNNKVYIALEASGPGTGGYAVLDYGANPKVTQRPIAAWNNQTVYGIAVDTTNSKVYAIADDGLYEADGTGKKGAKLDVAEPAAAAVTAGATYVKGTGPAAGYRRAKFAKGGGLVVATATELHVLLPGTPKKTQ